MANEVRIGKISSVDPKTGTVRVVYHDNDDNVTGSIPMLDTEYNMPQIGEQVLVLHLSSGGEFGVILGRPWSRKNMPPEAGKNIYRKDMGQSPGDAMLRYDGAELTIECSGNISIKAGGTVSINGTVINLN